MAWLSVIAVGFIPVLLDAVVKKILWWLPGRPLFYRLNPLSSSRGEWKICKQTDKLWPLFSSKTLKFVIKFKK
jgi:hypothetical protein